MNNTPTVTIGRLTFKPSILWTLISSVSGRKRPTVRRENIEDRNKRMLLETDPDLIMAFGAGLSTEQLLREARRRSIKIIEIEAPTNPVKSQHGSMSQKVATIVCDRRSGRDGACHRRAINRAP